MATPLILRWNKLIVDALLLGTCKIKTFLCPLLVPPTFFASSHISTCRRTIHITYLDPYVLMYNLLYECVLAKVGPDQTYLFKLPSNLWSYGFHRLCIGTIYSFWESVTGWVYFDKILFQVLISRSYRGKNWMYNPNIPMSMQRHPHVFGHSNLAKASFL